MKYDLLFVLAIIYMKKIEKMSIIIIIIMMDLILDYKKIHDTIHGYIDVSNYALKIIDTKQFKRLKKLRQLGVCVYIYPNANHTRFEHSLGTYHLAGKILDIIKKKVNKEELEKYLKSIPELSKYFKEKKEKKYELDDYVCELIKIAALCHDLGHGPFSHLFDDYLESRTESANKTHETRSINIIKDIIKKDKELSEMFVHGEIEFIQNIINPTKDNKGFLYQIVSNSLNSLDVDKYDYLTRDSYMLGLSSGFDYNTLINNIEIIKNTICYSKSSSFEIFKLFNCRYTLHKQIYGHTAVISIQMIMIELFKHMDVLLNLIGSINNLEDFYLMTDEYLIDSINFFDKYVTILNIEKRNSIKEAKKLLDLFDTHKIYSLVYSSVNKKEKPIELSDIKKINDYDDSFDKEIIIYNCKMGYVSGNKGNPLSKIYVYSNKDKLERELINFKKISQLTPASYQEHITYIYYKNKDDVKSIKKLKKILEQLEQLQTKGQISDGCNKNEKKEKSDEKKEKSDENSEEKSDEFKNKEKSK